MRGLGLVILVVFVSAVTSVVTVMGVQRFDLVPRPVAKTLTVPSLKGLTEADARQNLKAIGLVCLVSERKLSSEGDPGTVIEQSPPPGQQVPENATVSVALARELPKVPNLVGHTLVEAVALAGPFKVEPGAPINDPNVPADHIVSQDPAPDSPRAPDRPVVVHVSLGKGEIEVPKLLGRPLDQVKEEAKTKGFELKVLWTEEGETTNYVVLSQNPQAGTKIKPGATVTVSVNH